MASGTHRRHRSGRRRRLRQRLNRRVRLHAAASPAARTRTPPPTAPGSMRSARWCRRRRSGALAASRYLPGAEGARPVLRLRPRERRQAVEARRRRSADSSASCPARGRDHLARVVRPDRSRAGQLRRHRARSPRAASACTCRCSSPRASTRTTADGAAPATSSRSRGWCDGCDDTARRRDASATARSIAQLQGAVPGRRPTSPGASPAARADVDNGRPFIAPYGFTVKVVASADSGRRQPDRRGPARDLAAPRPRPAARASRASARRPADAGTARPRRCWSTSTATTATSWSSAARDGIVHALRPDGSELPGWPVRGDPLPLHTGERAFDSGDGRAPTPVGRSSPRSPSATSITTASRRSSPPTCEGKVYGWSADGHRVLPRAVESRLLRQAAVARSSTSATASSTEPSTGSSARRCSPTSTATARQEVIAAAMDRHVYAWHDATTRRRWPGFPVLVVDPRQGRRRSTPTRTPVTFNADAGAEFNRARSSTRPAVGDSPATADPPEIVVGTNEEYDGGPQRAATSPSRGSGRRRRRPGLTPATQPALRAEVDRRRRRGPGADNARRTSRLAVAGRPGCCTELLPVVGEGITGSPVIGPVELPAGGAGPKVGVMPAAGLGYVLNPNGDVLLPADVGQAQRDARPRTPAAPTTRRSPRSVTRPSRLGRRRRRFLAPATGLIRALDLAASEYQRRPGLRRRRGTRRAATSAPASR